jgi:putative hydrolase of the HAD superfamily
MGAVMPIPAALILDFDGLILDTETPLLDSWEQVHTAHGLSYDRAKGHNIIGHSGVYYDPWEAFPTAHDRTALEAEFEQMKDRIILQQPILPGVVDLLAAARKAGIALGVASNSHHQHVDRHLERLGLAAHFSAVTCRDDVSEPKPAPEVYLLACERLGVPPAEAIAFEDSVPGHLAAHRAGLAVVVVPNPSTRQYDFAHASQRLDSLAQFELAARV